MVALSVQALLLMAAAYFLGAALACIIRRSFAPAVRTAATGTGERRVDPLPEVAQRDAQAAAAAAARAAVSAPAQVAPPAATATPTVSKPAPTAVAAPVGMPQDLKSIQGIDAATEARLKSLGIARFEQIAAWTRSEVERIGQALGQKGRIARENWIEQAQILAKGGQTLFSLRRARGEGSTAVPTPDEGVPGLPAPPAAAPSLPLPMSRVGVSAVVIGPPQTAAPATTPSVADRAAFAQPAEPAAAVPIRPAEPPARDNLQRIGGITAEIEHRLNALGVARYSQIAHWSPVEVERFDRELGLGGRISRGNWIEQAHILSRGGDTVFSRGFDRHGAEPPAPPGPPPRPIKLPDAIKAHGAATAAGRTADLSGLRSVRSEAYQDTGEPGPEAARRAAARKVARTGPPDDLKRIRGIGVLIERKLNALGVTSYEDIANWTAADIDRVSQQLDFKGRIQREGWVEQARILAAGGDTEFSRRLDRRDGDGRPKS
jgi:predicted flap endonuclease-1-like 5' DNA nuclease